MTLSTLRRAISFKLLLFPYFLATLILAVEAWRAASWVSGACFVVASALSMVAVGGWKAGLAEGGMRIGISIVAIVMLALSYWMSREFTVRFEGVLYPGALWVIIGATLGWLVTEVPFSRPS